MMRTDHSSISFAQSLNNESYSQLVCTSVTNRRTTSSSTTAKHTLETLEAFDMFFRHGNQLLKPGAQRELCYRPIQPVKRHLSSSHQNSTKSWPRTFLREGRSLALFAGGYLMLTLAYDQWIKYQQDDEMVRNSKSAVFVSQAAEAMKENENKKALGMFSNAMAEISHNPSDQSRIAAHMATLYEEENQLDLANQALSLSHKKLQQAKAIESIDASSSDKVAEDHSTTSEILRKLFFRPKGETKSLSLSSTVRRERATTCDRLAQRHQDAGRLKSAEAMYMEALGNLIAPEEFTEFMNTPVNRSVGQALGTFEANNKDEHYSESTEMTGVQASPNIKQSGEEKSKAASVRVESNKQDWQQLAESVAGVLNNLAMLYYEQGKSDEAILVLTHAWKICGKYSLKQLRTVELLLKEMKEETE